MNLRAIAPAIRDVRYAWRALLKTPGFTLPAIAVLALAIGANTAMFSVLNAVLLQPLPYPSPEQLAMLWTEIPERGIREGRLAYSDVEQLRSRSVTIADIAVLDPVTVTLSGEDGAERIGGTRVSANLFALLGIEPAQGRAFTAEEAEQRQHVALISDRLWLSRFRGSDEALGATLELDGVRSRVIGILPPDFPFGDADVWEPHTLFADWDARRGVGGPDSWLVVARLRSGASVAQARAEVTAIARALDAELPRADRERGIGVVPLDQQVTGPRAQLALWLLTGAVLCVLLLGAINVASLSLARTVGRARELAIRTALGASQARITAQVLVECLLLAVVSGVLGLLVAFGGIRAVVALNPGNLARLDDAALSLPVLGWAAALCVLCALLVGSMPALMAARPNLRAAVQEGGRGAAGARGARSARRALVVTEFALAILLLVGAGLLLRSWWSAENVDAGFEPEQVLSAQLAAPPAIATNEQRADFYARVLDQVDALPNVDRAGIVGDFFIGSALGGLLTLEDAAATGATDLRFRRDEVSAELFTVLGTPLLRGRFFSAEDRAGSARVAIVNDAMARRLWPASDPLGRRFKLGPPQAAGPWFTVVGVVGDMRRQGLETEPVPQMFEPLSQNPSRLATLLVRTSVDDPLRLTATIRAAVSRVETDAPVYAVTTLDARLAGLLGPRRFQTSLLTAFSAAALLMAAIGIYGLVQYSVATRTREIGIRVAVGARDRDILRMFLAEGLKLCLAGSAVGLLGAVAIGRAGSSLLFGVTATDPWTFTTVPLLLGTVAAAACYLPARRAARLAPVAALHE